MELWHVCLMTGSRYMDKKHQKYPQNGDFPPFVTPQDFFQKSGSVTFVPLGRSLRYLKTEGQTDGQTDGPLRTPSGEPGVQNNLSSK